MSQSAGPLPAAISAFPSAGAEPGYFQRRLPPLIILASFFLVTLPLCVLAGGDETFVFRRPIGLGYVWALAMTHFVLTFVVYFQAANVRYFWSTWGNRLTYFFVPAIIFAAFDLYHALELAVLWPLFDLVLRMGIRLMDFQHFTRQNYGVLQLFRMRSGQRFPGWMRQAENLYFSAMTVLLLMTYLSGGHFRPDRPILLVGLAIVSALFVWVMVGFAVAWSQSTQRRALLWPLAYFLLQTASAALAVYSTWLYSFGLAMHYVEYHVLMIPRCFHTSLDAQSTTDRWFGLVRRHKLLFYGVVLVLAVPVTRFAFLGMSAMIQMASSPSPVPSRLLITVFDGIFVFHYVIESRIWKFADPFYRQTLVPLYFGHKRPATAAAAGPHLNNGLPPEGDSPTSRSHPIERATQL